MSFWVFGMLCVIRTNDDCDNKSKMLDAGQLKTRLLRHKHFTETLTLEERGGEKPVILDNYKSFVKSKGEL